MKSIISSSDKYIFKNDEITIVLSKIRIKWHVISLYFTDLLENVDASNIEVFDYI